MAWNKPTSNTADATSSSRPSGRGKMPRLRRGLIAGVVVIVLGFAVLAILSGGDDAPKAKADKGRGRIKEVAPAVTNVPAKTEKELHPGMVKVRGKWYPEYDEKGGKIWVTSNAVMYHTPKIQTNKVNQARLSKEMKIFSRRADVEIAVLINAEPGTGFIGDYRYGDRFVKDFLDSLTTPIIISEDDDENTKALKKAVRETKIELKARYDNGEDIGQIMADTRKNLQELGAYREELRREVDKVRSKGGMSPEELNDLYGAANKMLAERGAKPLAMPTLLKRKLDVLGTKNNNTKK